MASLRWTPPFRTKHTLQPPGNLPTMTDFFLTPCIATDSAPVEKGIERVCAIAAFGLAIDG